MARNATNANPYGMKATIDFSQDDPFGYGYSGHSSDLMRIGRNTHEQRVPFWEQNEYSIWRPPQFQNSPAPSSGIRRGASNVTRNRPEVQRNNRSRPRPPAVQAAAVHMFVPKGRPTIIDVERQGMANQPPAAAPPADRRRPSQAHAAGATNEAMGNDWRPSLPRTLTDRYQSTPASRPLPPSRSTTAQCGLTNGGRPSSGWERPSIPPRRQTERAGPGKPGRSKNFGLTRMFSSPGKAIPAQAY